MEKDGKFYYYTTVQAGDPYNSKVVGVAVSDSPTGPFVDPRGTPLVTDDMTPNGARGWWNDIDPTVFIDDDGTPWMSWGNGTCFLVKLKPNMIELDGPIEILKMPKYVEGPWLHKHGNLYYLTYASMGKGRETISYATAPSMEGPWTYRGLLTGMAENSFTIHPGIIEFKGQSYLFYHNATLTLNGKSGATGRRSVCVDYLYYLPDGRMAYVEQTKEGITAKPKNPTEVAAIINPSADEEEKIVEKENIMTSESEASQEETIYNDEHFTAKAATGYLPCSPDLSIGLRAENRRVPTTVRLLLSGNHEHHVAGQRRLHPTLAIAGAYRQA